MIKTTENNNDNIRPMAGIAIPEENDVPMGRGGFVNTHPGHRRYMKMVQEKQLEYAQCKKADKMEIAWGVVRELRAMDPPSRFLRKDPATGLWSDVGDKKFREKVSQALRENQPSIKAVIHCDDEDCEPLPLPVNNRPTLLVSENKRRAFHQTRTEEKVVDVGLPVEEDVGFALSEFSVSQGPSFPDLDCWETEEPEHKTFRRNSSGLEELLELLEDRQPASKHFDALNESNISLSAGDVNRIWASLDNEKIDAFALSNASNDSFSPQHTTKRSSNETSNDCLCPVIKRCTLSRDKSEVSKKLKETYGCAAPLGFEEMGMDSLLSALEQSYPFVDTHQ